MLESDQASKEKGGCMNIRECYQLFGGDFGDVMNRLLKEERVIKYAKMFSASVGNDYEQIRTALSEERYEDAFRAVHNLKGVSLNLALTPLHQASHVLCEALRHGKPSEDPEPLLQKVEEAWNLVTGAFSQLA